MEESEVFPEGTFIGITDKNGQRMHVGEAVKRYQSPKYSAGYYVYGRIEYVTKATRFYASCKLPDREDGYIILDSECEIVPSSMLEIEECDDCDGSGERRLYFEPGSYQKLGTCWTCMGSGHVHKREAASI